MTIRKNVLDQELDIAGSSTQDGYLDLSEESQQLGPSITGQSGSSASIIVSGPTVTITGLTGMSEQSVGRFLTLTGAALSANNGTFRILTLFSISSVEIENPSAATDANNGSISWLERDPYSLETDINYIRTDRQLIKGVDFDQSIPVYQRPDDLTTDVPANLANIAGKTTDAKSVIVNKKLENVTVSVGDGYVTIFGNFIHSNSVNTLGIPIFDGFDSGNNIATFAEIIQDGYGTGLFVKFGANKGNRIFGRTRAGTTGIDGYSIEIEFLSVPVGSPITSAVSYTWEVGQTESIDIFYGFRERLDNLDDDAFRTDFVNGILGRPFRARDIFVDDTNLTETSNGNDLQEVIEDFDVALRDRHKALSTGADEVPGFLDQKILAGDGIDISTITSSIILPIGEYFINEASLGTDPTAVLDSRAGAVNLAIDYDNNLEYKELNTGRGIEYLVNGSSGSVTSATVNGTKYKSGINGNTKFSFEVVADLIDHNNATPIIGLVNDDQSVSHAMEFDASGVKLIFSGAGGSATGGIDLNGSEYLTKDVLQADNFPAFFTQCCWFRADGFVFALPNRGITGHGNGGIGPGNFFRSVLIPTGTHDVRLDFSGGAGTEVLFTYTDDVWYFLAVVGNGSTTTVYWRTIGETRFNSRSVSATAMAGTEDYRIRFGSNSFDLHHQGAISNCRMWKTSLTEDELLIESSSDVAVKTSNIFVDLPADSANNSEIDQSGQGNDFTAVGEPYTVVTGPVINSGGAAQREYSDPGDGRKVYQYVFDSTQALEADRIKFFIDGILQTPDASPNPVVLNDTINILNTQRLVLGNIRDGYVSLKGSIYYAAVYDDALSDIQAAANATVLLTEDDQSPAAQNDQLVISSDFASELGGDLDGYLPNPQVIDLTIQNEQHGSLLYFDGYNWVQLDPGVDGYFLRTSGVGAAPEWFSGTSGPPSGPAGGDLGGTYPNPTVIDFTLTNEQHGSVVFFNGFNWVTLDPSTDGYVLTTHGAGADPTWEASGGTGITDITHAALRQLIHLADGIGGPFEQFASGAFREILPIGDPFPTSIIWYESSAKTQKIVEKTIIRNSNKTPSSIEWKVYDTDGSTVLATVTDVLTYSGVIETDRTRVIS